MSEGRQERNKLRLYLDGEFRPSNKDVLTAIPDPYTLRTQWNDFRRTKSSNPDDGLISSRILFVGSRLTIISSTYAGDRSVFRMIAAT